LRVVAQPARPLILPFVVPLELPAVDARIERLAS
jgi:hypothetical protein